MHRYFGFKYSKGILTAQQAFKYKVGGEVWYTYVKSFFSKKN